MSTNYIEAQEILNATSGGLDIIFWLYPQAMGSEKQNNRKFKLREEKSASASLKKATDGNWLVTDFGDDQTPRNAVQCYMIEKNVGYVQALRELAATFNVVSDEKKAEMIKADYSQVPASAEDEEGAWSWELRDSFTDNEIETIISKKVLEALNWYSKDEDKRKLAYNAIRMAFKEYRWFPVVSYSTVKDRKVHTFSSTATYPIFMIDEETHKKLYQPKHPDKTKRFLYIGAKPKDFIHGLDQLNKAFEKKKKEIEQELNDDAENEDHGADKAADKKSDKDARLPEVILCSGGSDAINVALLGYRVIWMNSETAKLHQWQYDKIMIKVSKMYQLPDIDTTGKKAAHELNMEYLDIYCIELPEALKKYLDPRGNPCKDVRDYFNYFSRKDFKQLVDTALPYRFWEKTPKHVGRGDNKIFAGFDYEFKNVRAYNFLLKNGFGRLPVGDKKTDCIYVRRVGNIVYEQHPNDIKNYIHEFLESRLLDESLRDTMYKSTQLGEGSLSNLKFVDIDFSDNTKESQFIFFLNTTAEVTGTEIKYHKPGAIDRYIWEEDLLQHRLD